MARSTKRWTGRALRMVCGALLATQIALSCAGAQAAVVARVTAPSASHHYPHTGGGASAPDTGVVAVVTGSDSAVQALAGSIATLRGEVRDSPVLSAIQKAHYARQLAAVAGQLPAIEGLQRYIAGQTTLLQALGEERVLAQAGLDRLQAGLRADLRAFTDALDFSTGAVTTTAQEVAVTATVSITTAHLDLQTRTAGLVLTVQTSAQVLQLLALNTRTRVDAERLAAHLQALATGIHFGLGAVLRDLRMLAVTDPSAASDAQSGLASGLTNAVITLNDDLLGTLDTRLSLLRLAIAHAQEEMTRLLAATATSLSMAQRVVLAGDIAAAPLDAAQQRRAMAGLDPVGDALRKAATASNALAGRLADVGALQDAQARIDREVQKAQADLDGTLAQADAALSGRLRSDVTVAISATEQTVHVHLTSIDVGALVRDLDFDVNMGLSVLQIAVLHAEVTPSTDAYTGTSRTTIQGVDLVLHASLRGLQARIRTDVAAVREEQATLSSAIRSRVATLRTTLSNVLAPLIARYQADITTLQGELQQDLATADSALRQARQALDRLAHIAPLSAHVTGVDVAPLRLGPHTRSTAAYWIGRDSWVPLVGYVWGDTVRNPHTGVADARWYVLRNFNGGHGYLYVPGALVEISPGE